ncbi:MAG TPA: YciI family protein [Solirubrobacteraceae bacterium]|nr:YciI family protein [Solirubrobacteraceae bacterium]
MRFMLLIYNNPATVETLSEQERTELFGEVDALIAELTESGEFVGGEALAHASTATTIRRSEGAVAATDGPFAEAKEQFAGYVAVDCESEERAVEIARRWPASPSGGAIEVRAVMDQAGTEM